MADGYNNPGSRTWHGQQRCSGTVFPPMAQMDSKIAENRGLSPCGNCCDGEWPHEDETADRDPDEWMDKLEPGETAFRLREPTWNGPEYIGVTEDGTFIRWPMGLGMNVSETSEKQVIADLENESIAVELVEDYDETPLTQWGEDGD